MAIQELRMPKLGESVTEGTITKWLVSPGDFVNKYEPVAEVLTDKVTAEIPSAYRGIIKEIVAKEGETLPVDAVICTLETEEEPAGGKMEKETDKIRRKTAEDNKTKLLKQRYSPAVLKLAEQHNIDLKKVKGTGRGGRITRKDVLKFIESNKTSIDEVRVIGQEQHKMEQKTIHTVSADSGMVEIPVTGIRKTIAENMVRSKREIPHAWMTVEADVTDLVRLRDAIKEKFKAKEGYPITYFAFFVKAVAQGLKEFPELNATWEEDKIVCKKDIHLSIAVATEDALFVPVIKHADEKSIKGIARDIYELAKKARTGTLEPENVRGGTFTVNNTGAFGSIQSMGIINYPQAAILQVEKIVKRPVIINNSIAIRDMVNLCLSIDHRVLDGLIAGRFLTRVKEILENLNEEQTNIY